MICTPNTGHLVWGYFYALDLLSQVKKLAQHSNSIFAICNSQLLPTNQKCGLLSYPKKTKNPNPSPIGNRFGFFLFGGRGWIRTTEAESSRFTVCPHWPLGNTPIFSFCSPWIACIYYHPDGSLSTSFAEFLDFCAESKNTKAKAAQKSTFLSGFLELVTGVERATGIASLKNGDFYTKICTFSCLFLVPSCTAHTPTKAKVC